MRRPSQKTIVILFILNVLSMIPLTAYAVFNDLLVTFNNISFEQGRWDFEPNEPMLSDGMNPVYWENNTEIVKFTDTNLTVQNPQWNEASWYLYRNTRDGVFNTRWANMKSNDGSYWVWIPRFVYKVRTNFHIGTTGTVDVSFVEGTDDFEFFLNLEDGDSANNADDTWTNHPAFTFGSTELTGFWVAKFLASNNSNVPRFIPGATTWTNLNVGTAFNEGRSIENEASFGFDASEVESMLIRNDQFVAVSILALSKYGRNNSLTTTPPNVATSGGGSGTFWTTENGINQSSTFNLFGIYDLGGAEYVPVYSNANPSLGSSPVVTSYNANPGLYAHRFAGYDDTINFKGHGFWEFASGTISRSYATGVSNANTGASAWGQQSNFAGYSNNTGTGGFYRDYVFRVGQFGFSQALNFEYTTLRYRATLLVL
jgi:hypothetical protein